MIKYVFTDIDDTLTDKGKLTWHAYKALWDLNDSGMLVVPVTGRSIAWCEMIVRTWPVFGVIGENGAFFMSLDKKMCIFETVPRKSLKNVEEQILKQIPNARLASDQFCRKYDLAIDICEDVQLADSEIDSIKQIFKQHGAHTKISSIHVNGWFGDYNKLTMIKKLLKNLKEKNVQDTCVYIGDSPNDGPCFGFFKKSYAVSNIKPYLEKLKARPKVIAQYPGGKGFCEIAATLLQD